MKRKITLGIALSALIITSCVKDLDVTPKDPNTILSGNVNGNPVYMKQVLAKIYASFVIYGQSLNSSDADITSSNDGFFTTARALWNLQEITTDEAICGWTDAGISDLNTQTWSPSNPFLTALYQRLGLSITYANDFIKMTNGSSDPDIQRYNAEARFLRALAYYWHMDLFGNPPFTTDNDGVGKFYPEQINRADLFNYIVSELKDIQNKLGAPKSHYPQADKAAAWMLLARAYLNAEVYTGTAKWDSCKMYCDSVIEHGGYALAQNYRQNFCADNDQSPEMIFAFAMDGINTQGPVATTFIIESSSDPEYIPSKKFHGITSNPDWNGNRARKDFLNVMIDTVATYGNVTIPTSDSLFATSKDTRVFLKRKERLDIPSASSSGDYGVGVYKFTAKNSDGSLPANFNTAYACTDFPIFRLADAYLMRAEAKFHIDGSGLDDLNYVRDRAFQAGDFDLTGTTIPNRLATISEQAILDERGREFYYEGQRRTDLVRFGKFTDGNYNWQWKGGVYNGTNTDSHLNIFPIPGDEVSANPNIHQNTGY
ncbi:membrane protein [Tenuifilaceae bacterium CYCD]|nr:membrane protein [Tenuifilaceae bacterium CYCD]